MEDRSQASSGKAGVGSGPSSAVSLSPPEVGIGRPLEDRREIRVFPTLPSNAPSSYSVLPLDPGSTLSNQGDYRLRKTKEKRNFDHFADALPPQEYGYPQEAETRSPWAPSSGFGAPTSAPLPGPNGHPNQHDWRYNQAGPSGDFAPFPIASMQPPPAPQHAQTFSYAQQRPDETWQHHQQPVRSMSYSRVEGGLSNNGGPYSGSYQVDPSHHLSPIRHAPPTLDMQNASMMAQAPGPHSAPTGHPNHAFVNQSHPYVFQNAHDHAPSTSVAPHHPYPGSWYSGLPSFGSVQEEQYMVRSHEPG